MMRSVRQRISKWRQGHVRRSVVSDEHLPIAPALLGTPLASVRRRIAALAFDVFVVSMISVPWTMIFVAVSIQISSPKLLPNLYRIVQEDLSESEEEALEDEAWADAIRLIAKRRPGLLPKPIHEAIARDDSSEIARVLSEEGLSINFQMSGDTTSYFDFESSTLHIRQDAVFGPFASIGGWFSVFLLYMTLFTWRLRGRSPGKALLGIRVARLDGRPITLGDAFGRTGGYSASLSTLGLGFIEVLWNPNRQTVHDRISGTVVVPGRSVFAVVRDHLKTRLENRRLKNRRLKNYSEDESDA